MDAYEAAFQSDAYKQYLRNKGRKLADLIDLNKKVLKMMSIPDQEEGLAGLLQSAEVIMREIDLLDRKFPSNRGFLGPEAEAHKLKKLNEHYLHTLIQLNKKILKSANERKDEIGSHLKKINTGKKANAAYAGGPKLNEGIFVDFKK